MDNSHFSRSLSEKLIEKGIKWESDKMYISGKTDLDEPHERTENCADDLLKCIPALNLETALSKDFLSQITTDVLSASTDIAWNFTAGGYEGAEKCIIKLLNEK